jgi:hypothetical protein
MNRNSVILDTSFLISLVDDSRPNHESALKFFKYFIENKIAMVLSSIVTSEFCIKQPLTDLPLANFKFLPFNIPDSYHLSHLFLDEFKGQIGSHKNPSIKDDYKIASQCSFNNVKYFITEDNDLIKKLRTLKSEGKIDFQILSLSEGVDVSFAIPLSLF